MEPDFETRLKEKVLAYENRIRLQLQKEKVSSILTMLIPLFILSFTALIIVKRHAVKDLILALIHWIKLHV